MWLSRQSKRCLTRLYAAISHGRATADRTQLRRSRTKGARRAADGQPVGRRSVVARYFPRAKTFATGGKERRANGTSLGLSFRIPSPHLRFHQRFNSTGVSALLGATSATGASFQYQGVTAGGFFICAVGASRDRLRSSIRRAVAGTSMVRSRPAN